MALNKEDLKNKILYRSLYRGSKEIYIMISSFVKSIINELNTSDLIKLNDLVNLDADNLEGIITNVFIFLLIFHYNINRGKNVH